MLYCHLQIHIYIYTQHHNNTINKQTQEDFLINYVYLSLYCKGSKRVTQCLRMRESWRPNITATFWPLLLWASTLCLSCSPDAQPEAQRPSSLLDDGFLYCILSASSLDPNSSGPQAPSAWYGFPYHIPSITPSPTVTGTGIWLSYIIVQRPLDRPLDLWNRMFDRHQAENNCHAVHRFLSSGASVYECTMGIFFTSSHFVSQFPPTRFPLITAIRMCHFLPVHHSEWHYWPGRRSKYHMSPSN